jgi:hemerythrin-like metal-binding protein
MRIEWQPGMETGAKALDEQRRTLVERADALVASMREPVGREGVERALRDFGDYAVRHFSQEEDCHLRGICPAVRWSGDARAELIAILSDFRLAFEREGSAPHVADTLSDGLCGWVARYIPGPDPKVPCAPEVRSAG